MISFWVIVAWLALSFVPFFILLLILEWRQRVRTREALDKIAAPEPLSLSDAWTRVQLQSFLAKHGVTGDADIRNGFVFLRSVGRAEPLMKLFANSFSTMAQTPNAVNGGLYFAVKKPGQGTGWDYRCSGISVYDINEAANLMAELADIAYDPPDDPINYVQVVEKRECELRATIELIRKRATEGDLKTLKSNIVDLCDRGLKS